MASLGEAGLGDQVGMVTGDSRTGGLLIMQEGINAISFTGSVAAGRQVAAGCAATGKTLQGELGGEQRRAGDGRRRSIADSPTARSSDLQLCRATMHRTASPDR